MEEIGWRLLVAELVRAIAWPLAFVVIGLAFREEVKLLLLRLRGMKVAGTELDFSETLDKARADARALDLPGDGAQLVTGAVVSDHPHLAIIEAWRSVETTLTALLRSLDPALPDYRTQGLRGIGELRDLEVVAPEVTELLSYLRRLRNTATHDAGSTISEGMACEYISLATRTNAALEDALNLNRKAD